MNPRMAPAAYVSDACFRTPRVTDSSYVPRLRAICGEYEIGMIVPTIDTELSILAENKELFAADGVSVIISSETLIAVCRDKRNTGRFFTEHAIRIPQPVDKEHPTFPFFAKPYDGSLNRDLHYIATPDELPPEIINNPKLIFMEYIDKTLYKEYTVDMYYGRDQKVKMIVPRERIEIRAGESNKGRTVKNELVNYIRIRLPHIEGCVGCICLQLFHNPQNDDVIGIEINPRFGGGYPLSYAAGANYPELLIREYFLHQHIDYSDEWKDDLLMLRYDDAVFI